MDALFGGIGNDDAPRAMGVAISFEITATNRSLVLIRSTLMSMLSRVPLLCLLCAMAIAAEGPTKPISDATVRKVHKAALLIDTHNDVTSRTVKGFDIGERSTEGHTDIPRMREGGLAAQFFAVYVAGSYVEGNRSAHRAMEMIDTVRHDIIDRYPNDFELALTADDVLRIAKRGKIAALMGIEGGHAIEDSPRLLRDFYALGIRYMTLTHSNSNTWAGSSGDIEGRTKGLTDLGKQIVAEMNRLGMMVDISHVSDKTFWDALEVSNTPLLASHSSCRSISNIPRNMTDEMIQALARKGGVMQVNFGCQFLSQESANTSRPMRESGQKTVPATLGDVVAHIDHVVKIAGVDHVGIGGDYDGVGCVPVGLDDVSKMPALTRALLEKGYTAADIRKIYSGNVLRVMREAEKATSRTRAGT